MALSLDKLLQENKRRYEMCTAAIRISQSLAELTEDRWKTRDDDKLAIVAMENVLSGRSIIQCPEIEDFQQKD